MARLLFPSQWDARLSLLILFQRFCTYRRGSTFEIETTRRESPTLYGITRRAVASKGASREGGGSSFNDTAKCPAFSTGHPTTTLIVRHTYNMEVCKTPDATTLIVYHTYIMRAMSPGSQAVTNTAVLTGDAPKIEGMPTPRQAFPPLGGGQTGSPQGF